MKRFAVIRVPTSGPPALVDTASIFDTEREARAHIERLEATQLKVHHTFLEVIAFEGKAHEALPDLGVLF